MINPETGGVIVSRAAIARGTDRLRL